MTDRWAGVPELLSRLEDLELPLLSWGIVDGFLSRLDVEAAIDAQLDQDATRPGAAYLTVEDYLDHLVETGLLHRLPDSTPKYRTRLAESLRLLRKLRQLWPPQDDDSAPEWWRQANTLVADYRLRVAPRRYPRRTIPAAEAASLFAEVPGWTDRHTALVKRIVGDSMLARFQTQAAASILSALASDQPAGRIVTAGTGSGKTLAFYLPALLDIAATAGTTRTGPHTLALYPRNELLRDQARETLRLVTTLGPLAGTGSAPVKIGLLYGDTPWEWSLKNGQQRWRGWQHRRDAWEVPYFPCLTENCKGCLLWPDSDRIAGRERLVCTSCTFATEPGTLAITRESMSNDPPDILFTSTEMLSQQSTSRSLARMLGWKGANGTRLVLLDEVHTYAGVHGAQVGLMLRRWRHANRRWGSSGPVMVGLSATLRNAGDYFASLIGTQRGNVEIIAPAAEELDPVSREYGVILRGDPVSGSQLLSTTIQTAMLIGRVLDNKPRIYGSVAFAFTDDLDVINRLFNNLTDAEGADPRGRAAGRVLADLRSPLAPQAGPRYGEGQSWDLPFALRRMDRALRVGRTSSQDVGVDNNADVIVATSSLEVGFNDPRVGAVIQHKAPRNLASFLQRRGRAGRVLAMRPLTVVVLSDYGRDRIAYQTYERLLDPDIDAQSLPIENRFVIKMQAAHALVDWLARKTGADVRAVLSPPGSNPHRRDAERVTEVLRDLLKQGDHPQDLAEYLRRSLALPADEVTAALWEEPRSLLLSVVPTALRRLESSWTPLPGEVDPGAEERTPLPEFMTRTLFDSLNTPDVQFELPPRFGDERPSMPIVQALREAVPGRVSHRFGHAHASLVTWLPVPPTGQLELNDAIVRGHGLGTWEGPDGQSHIVVRPLAIRLVSPPSDVVDTSTARPVWRSAFLYTEAALHQMDVPLPSVWAEIIGTCAFALHVSGAPIRVRRMTIGSDGELARRSGARQPVHVRYVHQGLPAAIGFELDVDGMLLEGQLPAHGADRFGAFPDSPAWRTIAFRCRVMEDQRLDDVANVFQRRWLSEVYLHAFIALGLEGREVARLPGLLAGGRWADNLTQFLAVAYRSDDTGTIAMTRTLSTLDALSRDPIVRAVIEEHGRLLASGPLRDDTSDLLDRIFLDTLANTVLTAAEELLPDAQESDLAVDVVFNGDTRGYRIFLTETSIGGLGLIEQLHRDYALDPRRFWDAVARACSPTESEEVDTAMREILADLVEPQSQIARAVARFRGATGVAEMDHALKDLLLSWTEADGPPRAYAYFHIRCPIPSPWGYPLD